MCMACLASCTCTSPSAFIFFASHFFQGAKYSLSPDELECQESRFVPQHSHPPTLSSPS